MITEDFYARRNRLEALPEDYVARVSWWPGVRGNPPDVPKLTPAQTNVLVLMIAVIVQNGGCIVRTLHELAELTNLSRKTVGRALALLAERDLVLVTPKTNRVGGTAASEYRLTPSTIAALAPRPPGEVWEGGA